MSYDEKCLELAELFLQEWPYHTTADATDLAQHIQDSIEEFLAGLPQDPQE